MLLATVLASAVLAGPVPSRYLDAVPAVSLPAEDGPQYGIPADMGVGDEVLVEGQLSSVERVRTRRIEGVRVPVAVLETADDQRIEARFLADMVRPMGPPPAAIARFADEGRRVLLLPGKVRAGSELTLDEHSLRVVAVARNRDSADVVVVEDSAGQRRSHRVQWTR